MQTKRRSSISRQISRLKTTPRKNNRKSIGATLDRELSVQPYNRNVHQLNSRNLFEGSVRSDGSTMTFSDSFYPFNNSNMAANRNLFINYESCPSTDTIISQMSIYNWAIG